MKERDATGGGCDSAAMGTPAEADSAPLRGAVRLQLTPDADFRDLIGRLHEKGAAVDSIVTLPLRPNDVESRTVDVEFAGLDSATAAVALSGVPGVLGTEARRTMSEIFGKRVIVIGGGAQVAQVNLGAVSEADRHNLRGERISVDTIPLVGEKELAAAVRAVADLPRAHILVLAGSIMGGEISDAVVELREAGVPVVALNMAGSVPDVADLVVSDPVQAGTMAVMAIADTARFSLDRQRGRRY